MKSSQSSQLVNVASIRVPYRSHNDDDGNDDDADEDTEFPPRTSLFKDTSESCCKYCPQITSND